MLVTSSEGHHARSGALNLDLHIKSLYAMTVRRLLPLSAAIVSILASCSKPRCVLVLQLGDG